MLLPLMRALFAFGMFISCFIGIACDNLVARDYFVNSARGNDDGDGSKPQPWRSLGRLSQTRLQPGDAIWFSRGSRFVGGLEVDQSGIESAPITFGAYNVGAIPVFSNSQSNVLYGNGIRVNGSYIVIQDLSFQECPAHAESIDVRNLGAVFLTTNADHVIVRDCEMTKTPIGITVYGQYTLIISNYIHDATEPIKPYWGPMGVVICSSHNEVSYNRFINYCAPSENYGHDGGAIEINDRSLPKIDISIHHNLSLRNQGFIEWVGRTPPTDPRQKRTLTLSDADGGSGPVIQDHFLIHHNVCMDYQSFLGLTGPCSNIRVENNTIIRTLAHEKPDSEDVVFWEYFGSRNISFLNNIFVWDGKTVEPVFSRGRPYHDYNLYYRTDGTNLFHGPNESAFQRRYLGGGVELNIGERIGDPLFRDLKKGNFKLKSGSPAIGAGVGLHHTVDFAGRAIPTNRPPSLGAYEYTEE